MPVFEPEFKPVAAVDENLYVFAPSRPTIHGYYRILFLEPLPEPVVHDFGPLNAGEEVTDVEIKELYQDNDNCANFRIIPLDDVEIKIKQPLGLSRWSLKNIIAKLDLLHGQYKPTEYRHLSEICIWEDESIYFCCKNPTRYPQEMNRVKFIGFRYAVEKLVEKPKVYTFFPVEGVKGSLVTGAPPAVTLSPSPKTPVRRMFRR